MRWRRRARASVQISPRRGAERDEQSARFRQVRAGAGSRSARRSRDCWRWWKLSATEGDRELRRRCKRSSKAPKTASPSNGASTTTRRAPSIPSATQFPTVFFAGLFGSFNEKPYFQAQPGAEKAPVVNFSRDAAQRAEIARAIARAEDGTSGQDRGAGGARQARRRVRARQARV